jgi:SAM-dependent methyltransferase
MAHDHNSTFVEMLDLDAEVLHEYYTRLLDRLSSLAGDVRRILDVGSGTGTGSVALARRFPSASVVALDASPELLAHLTRRAHTAGLGDRIHPLEADLDNGWPALEPVDLAWASASMHHMGDPDRVVADVLATLRPGGLFAIVELTGFPRFLPGTDPVEERLHACLAERNAHRMPHMGDDWGARLAKAGFLVEDAEHYDIHLTAPLPAATGRYAQVTLQRLGENLADRLTADERAALHTLLGGDLAGRDDLQVRASRTLWAGRRP